MTGHRGFPDTARVSCETVPASAQTGPRVPAVYLPPIIDQNARWLHLRRTCLPQGLTGRQLAWPLPTSRSRQEEIK
jgi:hypothetical protein